MKAKFEIGSIVKVKSKYDGSIYKDNYKITSIIPYMNTFCYTLKLDNTYYGIYNESQLIKVK